MAEVIFRGRVLTSDGEARRQVTVADGVITEIRPFDRLRAQDGMRPELVEGRTSPTSSSSGNVSRNGRTAILRSLRH